MNPSDQANNFHPISRAVLLAMLAASAAVAGFAISNQSYWIDEATSLIVAMAPNPAEAWKYANAVGGSTIQMPLYNIYLYAWHKIFGGGEWVMRAANIPFFVFGQLAFLLLLRSRPRLALTACGLSLVCPTLWMYLDEARPYIMQYAAAAFIYLTPVALEDVPGRAWAMQAPQWDNIRFKFPPRVIVMSKPDIYDPSGAVARYAAENRFAPALKLHAFTIFTRENDPLPSVSP